MLRERSRRRREAPDSVAKFPRIDFNNARTRGVFLGVVFFGFIFIVGSLLGSYQAYHYTDSDQFCGTTCHSVMHPEYIAYSRSPHARVGCVKCHIGSGATWYMKSKLSGAYQVYSVIAKKYPKPIPTPVENLRPAQQTCEQCHWPGKFFGAQMKVFNHFGYDEANTPRETRMLIKTGGGSPALGLTSGIHWHMNIGNEITYIATDRQRQKIPWGTRAQMMRTSHHPVREGKMECASCHDPHSSATKGMLKADSVNELCYSCHAEKRGPFLWEHAPVRENCSTCHQAHGSNHDKLLVAKMPYLCQRCHLNTRHPGTLYDLRNTQLGTNPSNRVVEHACKNCHQNVHGSNHPSAPYLGR